MGLAFFSLTLSAFVTSTVAWFAVSDYLRVDNIMLSFEGEEIKIGMKNEEGEIDWDEKIVNYNQVYLSPVSTMFQDNDVSNYDIKQYPTFSNSIPHNSDAKGGETGIATTGFHQMEVFLKCEVGTYVYLDKTTAIKANAPMNGIIAGETGASIADLNNVENAMRVHFYTADASFIYEPNVEESSKTKFAGLLDVQPWDKFYDYDSSSMEEVLYGEYNSDAVLYYDDPALTEAIHPETEHLGEGFKGKTQVGVKHLDIQKSIDEGNLRIKEEQTYALDELTVGGQEIVYLYPGVATRLVITFYLEGWDLDCTSSLINAAFTAELNFRGYQMPKQQQ